MVEIYKENKSDNVEVDSSSSLMEVWGERFALSYRFSSWINKGIEMNLAQNTDNSKEQLAREVGMVFSFAYLPETGGELFSEDVNSSLVANEVGIPHERVEAIKGLMVESGLLKSRQLLEQRKRDARFGRKLP